MQVVSIRKATQDDLQDIQQLNLQLFKKEAHDYNSSLDLDWPIGRRGTAYFRKRLEEDAGVLLVATVGNVIVGYLCGALLKSEEYCKPYTGAELENMFVSDLHRSKGIGQELCEHFFEWCTSKSVERIRVEASAANRLAIQFYARQGFEDYSLVLEKRV